MKERLKVIGVNLCRVVVGLVFVFSGYVKAVDPIGSQYKITDYLTALGMGWMPDWVTLTASVLLSAVEFCTGIFLLLAIRRRITSRVLLAFMLVMTGITVWLVAANPVKDCGCFGDALHLTNGQSLAKNIVLLVMSGVIVRWPLCMKRMVTRATQWITINYTVLFILATSAWCLWALPLIDFRPYHVGVNIPEAMAIPDGAPQPQFDTKVLMEKNGRREWFSIDDYPDSTWKYIDTKTEQVSEGYVPPIHDLSIENAVTGDDITDSVVNYKGYMFLLVSPHLEQADDSNFGIIDQIYEYAQSKGYGFLCLTASGAKAVAHWTDITGADYPFAIADETTLKTMIRSNPGLMLLKNGTIVGKWSHNRLPALDETSPRIEKTGTAAGSRLTAAENTARAVLFFVVPLVLIVLADRMWAWSRSLRSKEADVEKKIKENSDKLISTFKSNQNEKENRSRQLEDERDPAGGHSPGKGDKRQP